MVTIKFIGGAKKSFDQTQLSIDEFVVDIRDLLTTLNKLKLDDTPYIDTTNYLIAVNGIDSSAISGIDTQLKQDDIISIIPIIHGGDSKKLQFKLLGRTIQLVEVRGDRKFTVDFFDDLRRRYPKLRLQAISSTYILNLSHLRKILNLSFIHERRDTLLAKRLETDVLLRFAITTQISEAIKTVGIKPNKDFFIIGIGPKSLLDSLYVELLPNLTTPLTKDNTSTLKKNFGISKRYIDTIDTDTPLEDILAEKAAVLF